MRSKSSSIFAYEAMESLKVEGAIAEIWVSNDENGTNPQLWDAVEAEKYYEINTMIT